MPIVWEIDNRSSFAFNVTTYACTTGISFVFDTYVRLSVCRTQHGILQQRYTVDVGTFVGISCRPKIVKNIHM